MAVKIYKPKTNGQRHKTSYTFEEGCAWLLRPDFFRDKDLLEIFCNR